MTSQSSSIEKSRSFELMKHDRYWWHRRQTNQYIPPIYDFLKEEEWTVLNEWYHDTEAEKMVGEMAVPMISVLQGFIMGNGIGNIVQCGHYSGYSTLLLGFMLRRMNRKNSLFSIDISESYTGYAQKWIDYAKLNDYVALHVSDSADSRLPGAAVKHFGGDIQCVIIDSSHQYEHTKREIELWYNSLASFGLMFLHDSSLLAKSYDDTNRGGVYRALHEWITENKVSCLNINSEFTESDTSPYIDGSGLALIQKPRTNSQDNPYKNINRLTAKNFFLMLRSMFKEILNFIGLYIRKNK